HRSAAAATAGVADHARVAADAIDVADLPGAAAGSVAMDLGAPAGVRHALALGATDFVSLAADAVALVGDAAADTAPAMHPLGAARLLDAAVRQAGLVAGAAVLRIAVQIGASIPAAHLAHGAGLEAGAAFAGPALGAGRAASPAVLHVLFGVDAAALAAEEPI